VTSVFIIYIGILFNAILVYRYMLYSRETAIRKYRWHPKAIGFCYRPLPTLQQFYTGINRHHIHGVSQLNIANLFYRNSLMILAKLLLGSALIRWYVNNLTTSFYFYRFFTL